MNLLNRREAIKRTTLTLIGVRLAQGASLLGVSFFMEGCNVFDDILNWVPVGEASINAMLTVLSSNGFPVAAPIEAAVTATEAAFTALTAAVQEYKATTPAPVGAVAKVQTALKDVVDQFGTFLASLKVPGNIFSVVAGLAQVVLSTIAAFEGQLPTAKTTARLVPRQMRIGEQTVQVVPKKRNANSYKKDWNATLQVAEKSGVTVPKNAYLQ
jgi:hypothetical protein